MAKTGIDLSKLSLEELQSLARDIEVYRGLHLNAECVSRGEGRLGLFDSARESVEDVAAGPGRGDDRFAQHVHHNAIGDQITVADIGLDRLPQRCLVPDVLTQQVATGDVRNAEPLGESLSLCSLTSARSTNQQQAHLITRAGPVGAEPGDAGMGNSRMPRTTSVLMARSSYRSPLFSNSPSSSGRCSRPERPRIVSVPLGTFRFASTSPDSLTTAT